ncbi:MAG: heat-inducible transcription repressor HrcA [Clostridia bacterium]|jgi:heat-inducible transcriptional repressor|nr:heat-inducible transcription repressor HrcA [Clostridia bacterium]
MNLGDRKRLILQAIIEDYINTAEPVGSRTISKKYLTNTSSATIRNEMADLEDMGYIEQPHTSAGRIPSDKGYRLYVDQMMGQQSLNKSQDDMIKKEFTDTLGEIDRLIKHASKLLSQMTQYTSIITTPQVKKTYLKHIQLIKIDSGTVLAIIITDAGIVKNSVLRLMRDVPNDVLEKISKTLNDSLCGVCVEDIAGIILQDSNEGYAGYKEIVEQILPELIQTLIYSDKVEVYHDGAANILNLPEFNDISKARRFFNTLEEKDLLFNVLKDSQENINVSIGSENKYEQLQNCSLITATYKVNGKTIGSIGVIGPTRMEYSKVISIVDCMTNNLSDILTKIIKY